MSSQDLYQLVNTNQLQEIRNWQDMNGAFHKSEKAEFLKLFEEICELGFQCGTLKEEMADILIQEGAKAHGRNEDLGEVNRKGIADEYGDALICMVAFRNKLALHSVDCVDGTLEKIRGRSWKPDKDGILRRPR